MTDYSIKSKRSIFDLYPVRTGLELVANDGTPNLPIHQSCRSKMPSGGNGNESRELRDDLRCDRSEKVPMQAVHQSCETVVVEFVFFLVKLVRRVIVALQLFQSRRRLSDALCPTTVDARNQSSVPFNGGQCSPCVTPLARYQCCCNCFSISWPGLTVTGSSTGANNLRAAAAAQSFVLGRIDWDSGYLSFSGWDNKQCEPYWISAYSPNPHICGWEQLRPHYASGTSVEAYLFVSETPPPTFTRSTAIGLRWNDALGSDTYNSSIVYQCANFTCSGGLFTLQSSNAYDRLNNPITITPPATIVLTASACETISSSSSSSH